jgi:hypothetical protein
MRFKKTTQSKSGNKKPTKSDAGKVAEPTSAPNPEKPPYLNEFGQLGFNLIPDEVWERHRRKRRRPRTPSHLMPPKRRRFGPKKRHR